MKNARFPQLFSAAPLALIIAGLMLSGVTACGTDDPTDKTTNCTQDVDCEAGFFCGDTNKCEQDCDPTAAEPGCAEGESCSTDGRCVVDGECVTDDDCDSPPAGLSCDGDSLVGHSQTGTCDIEDGVSVCNYSETRTACENGCEEGACLADACEQVVCDSPPAPVCDADGTTLIEYTSGTCLEGTCDYLSSGTTCANGCLNGVCVDGACDDVVCDDAPEDTCDGDTVLRYGATGVCVDNNGAPFCEHDLTFEDCRYAGAQCTNALCVGAITQNGPIVIVEYMANPAGSFNDFAEWFEVVNISAAAVNLDGWVIRSQGASAEESHVITAFGEIAPGERKVFGYSDTAPFTIDYNYGDVTLANNSDWLSLETADGQVSDYIYYEPGSILAGRSRKLNPDVAADAAANDAFANWCPSMSDEFSQNPSNYGTPGAVNTACAVDPCAGVTCEAPAGFCVDGEN